VIVPLIVAAVTNWLRAEALCADQADTASHAGRTALNHLYVALVAPLGELSARLGWGVLIVIGLILTYTLCYNIWSSSPSPSTSISSIIRRTRWRSRRRSSASS
jgi:PAT family beta-lactamase induction signal transducer AmpG